ncbi:helix-turn-helix domain-containing protein [Actinokineospora spheciospongiae]|uniref:helix-turn-helix domain-containing protein n=1 Tax=Actinokineospora spheciospongiae TaxID=909613 RepID=UPI0005579E58|nr:XRE family transcriptional regulator [Actinokineospora spheciospongiae]
MEEDWSAVAKAIKSRTRELGLRQRQLADRSQVSQAIIRELENHTVERRRNSKTLEALSLALEWHPGHLTALLHGKKPLRPGETGDQAMDTVLSRLEAIQDRLADISDRLDGLTIDVVSLVSRNDHRDEG